MQHLPAGLRSVVLTQFIAVLSMVCVITALPVLAQDNAAPTTTSQTGDSATAGPSDAHEPAPSKTKDHDSKYDLDRIGRRGVGHGWNSYSLEKERALGEAMSSVVDQHNRLLTDPQISEYVNALAQKLVRNSDAEIPFTVKIIDSPESGIFSLPGGFLYINKGLIEDVENEAELAGLMAHEIAHVTARHFTRTATRAHTWNMFSMALMFAGPVGFGVREAGGIAAPLTFRKMSRDAEREADLIPKLSCTPWNGYTIGNWYEKRSWRVSPIKIPRRKYRSIPSLAKPSPAIRRLRIALSACNKRFPLGCRHEPITRSIPATIRM